MLSHWLICFFFLAHLLFFTNLIFSLFFCLFIPFILFVILSPSFPSLACFKYFINLFCNYQLFLSPQLSHLNLAIEWQKWLLSCFSLPYHTMRLSLFNLGPVKLSSLSNLPGVCVWETQPQLVFRFSTTPNSWYPEFPQNPFAYWSSSHTWLHGHNSIYHVNPFSVLGGGGGWVCILGNGSINFCQPQSQR